MFAPPSTITEQDIRVMQRLKLRRLYGEVESKFYRQASKTQLLPVFRDGGVVWKTARRVGKVKQKVATYLARAKGGGAANGGHRGGEVGGRVDGQRAHRLGDALLLRIIAIMMDGHVNFAFLPA